MKSPEEFVFDAFYGHEFGLCKDIDCKCSNSMRSRAADAVRSALDEERERCARIAEKLSLSACNVAFRKMAQLIAENIRMSGSQIREIP